MRLLLVALVVAAHCVAAFRNYEYSKSLALAMADHIRASECWRDATSGPFSHTATFEGFSLFGSSIDRSQRAYVGYYAQSNAIVVAFEGSRIGSSEETSHFFSSNLDAAQVPFEARGADGLRVHRGFHEQYKRHKANGLLYRTQLAAFHLSKRGPLRIYACGYSQGAALASMLVADLLLWSPQLAGSISLVSFGAPRVGNGEFAKLVSSVDHVLRVVSRGDVVPRLPLRKFGYVQIGDEFWVSKFGDLVKWCQGDANPECSAQTIGAVGDHRQYFVKGFLGNCSIPLPFQPADLRLPFSEIVHITDTQPVPWVQRATVWGTIGAVFGMN